MNVDLSDDLSLGLQKWPLQINNFVQNLQSNLTILNDKEKLQILSFKKLDVWHCSWKMKEPKEHYYFWPTNTE